MPHDAKKLAGVALLVLRMTRGPVRVVALVALGLVALLSTLFVRPPSAEAPGAAAPPSQQAETSTRREPASSTAESEDVLTPLGRDAYRSPAGLRYTRGSVHGHRIDHLLAHTRDDPDRDGPHGVFDATDKNEVVLLVDEAYEQAKTGHRTKTREQGERTVYEVDLGRRVGYVGGRKGARDGLPSARRVRLVVEGDRLITAFPIAR